MSVFTFISSSHGNFLLMCVGCVGNIYHIDKNNVYNKQKKVYMFSYCPSNYCNFNNRAGLIVLFERKVRFAAIVSIYCSVLKFVFVLS